MVPLKKYGNYPPEKVTSNDGDGATDIDRDVPAPGARGGVEGPTKVDLKYNFSRTSDGGSDTLEMTVQVCCCCCCFIFSSTLAAVGGFIPKTDPTSDDLFPWSRLLELATRDLYVYACEPPSVCLKLRYDAGLMNYIVLPVLVLSCSEALHALVAPWLQPEDACDSSFVRPCHPLIPPAGRVHDGAGAGTLGREEK